MYETVPGMASWPLLKEMLSDVIIHKEAMANG